MSGLMLGVVTLRTADVASLSGYSVQQVRQLESRGVIPAAAREDNGYRRYSGVHVSALSAYRDLAFAIGPVAARSVMTELPRLDPKEAIALLTSTVTEVDELRRQVVAARSMLLSIQSEASVESETGDERGGEPTHESMTITELAEAIGVGASTLRYWESEGLTAPDRVGSGPRTARLYRFKAIRDARITAALRSGGYGIHEIRAALAVMRELGDTSSMLAALDDRLGDLALHGAAVLRAGGVLSGTIGEEHP
ncbi:MerR family transcriptional regulator [Brevibacterium sp.]|uniref:MerR family transcriptional regulator n=1 Tax=Brevibacterium sp. TaxID=1701 RepID=UPI002620FFCA|nr:MerR family transcriptional regulator [Brevibacterium sp.]